METVEPMEPEHAIDPMEPIDLSLTGSRPETSQHCNHVFSDIKPAIQVTGIFPRDGTFYQMPEIFELQPGILFLDYAAISSNK
jgi:hypothetical protein